MDVKEVLLKVLDFSVKVVAEEAIKDVKSREENNVNKSLQTIKKEANTLT